MNKLLSSPPASLISEGKEESPDMRPANLGLWRLDVIERDEAIGKARTLNDQKGFTHRPKNFDKHFLGEDPSPVLNPIDELISICSPPTSYGQIPTPPSNQVGEFTPIGFLPLDQETPADPDLEAQDLQKVNETEGSTIDISHLFHLLVMLPGVS